MILLFLVGVFFYKVAKTHGLFPLLWMLLGLVGYICGIMIMASYGRTSGLIMRNGYIAAVCLLFIGAVLGTLTVYYFILRFSKAKYDHYKEFVPLEDEQEEEKLKLKEDDRVIDQFAE